MKVLLASILISIGFLSLGQTIPNGDFEKWETRDHFKLDEWYTPIRNVRRTSDAKVGNYALKLSNTYRETANGYRGVAYTINYNDKSLLNGFAFDGDPLSAVFWSKHDLAAGDTARFYAVFREKGRYRGKVDFRFSGSTNGEYVKYTIPISWNGIRTPDSVWLYLYSSIHNKIQGDGYVIFDDIHFDKIGERMPDVTNADFENWTNIGVEFPSSWRTKDLIYYESYASLFESRTNVKLSGEDAFRGNHSLLIKNREEWEGDLKHGYAFIGTRNNHSYTRAFAVKDSFKYVQGYYKYLPDGEDTARIMYRTWEGSRGRSYDILELNKATEWTFFTLPINYYSDDAVPDSAALLFHSTVTDSIHGINSALYLDNLSLVMKPTPLSLNTVEELSSTTRLYPNPANNILIIDTKNKFDGYIIRDMMGRNVLISQFEKRIDISLLNDGMYTITLLGDNQESINYKFLKNSAN